MSGFCGDFAGTGPGKTHACLGFVLDLPRRLGKSGAELWYNCGMKVCLIALAALLAGCSSVSVGMPVPVPGPVKPHVGATFSRDGVSGHAGAAARVGRQPVYVGGTSDTIKLEKK